MTQLPLLPQRPTRFDGNAFATPDQPSLCDRLAAYLTAGAGQWIDGRDLALVAGAYGWRTRVSDLRRPPYNLTILNRQRKEGRCTVSEYRLGLPEDADQESS